MLQALPRAAALELRDASDDEIEHVLAQLEPEELEALTRTWQLAAHEYQLRPTVTVGAAVRIPPIWYLNGGRGSGKTRAMAERRLDRGEDYGPSLRGLLAGPTLGDVRDVMIEGESGLIACAERRGYKVEYVANRKLVKHPTGARWLICTSEEPDGPRGKQSNDIWGDEPSSWKHAIAFFDNLMLGHRLKGAPCEADFSSTPKPNPITRRFLRDRKWRARVAVTSGISAANYHNLSDTFRENLRALYEGTKLGKQELLGELLDDTGACVEQGVINRWRVPAVEPGQLWRKVVSLDPAATSKVDSDASGLVVVGSDAREYAHAYVLEDLTLESAPPPRVAEAAVDAWIRHGADVILYESNNGGEWIENAIRAAADARGVSPEIESKWSAKAKQARFEPVGALYERGRIHHVGRMMAIDPVEGIERGAAFLELEREATSWIPGEPSPNRLDALAQAVTYLLLGEDQIGPLSGYL